MMNDVRATFLEKWEKEGEPHLLTLTSDGLLTGMNIREEVTSTKYVWISTPSSKIGTLSSEICKWLMHHITLCLMIRECNGWNHKSNNWFIQSLWMDITDTAVIRAEANQSVERKVNRWQPMHPNITQQLNEDWSNLLFGRSRLLQQRNKLYRSWVDAVMRADENEMLHQLCWLCNLRDDRSLTMTLTTAEGCGMLCCLLKERWRRVKIIVG